MKILVTGGAGFLGSHLCEMLLKLGHEVISLDSFLTGNENNIKHLHNYDLFRSMRRDVLEPLHIEVDAIYNLASPASPIHYQRDPIQTSKTNVIGALNMLELSKKCNAKILQASTSEVYGDPEEHPQTETYHGNVNPIGPRSCYDEGKRMAESLFFDHHRQYESKIKVIRIFNTYGARMHPEDGRVVSNFIVQALTGENITIYGEGGQTRSFCYVDDLIDGMERMMDSKDQFTGPVNLGNPDEFTILELANIIIQLTGSKSQLVFRPLPQDDPIQRRPDITLAKRELQWEPKVSLEEGLLRTIAYFKNIV
jgi:UDP-glucuronate decarboxylase